LSITFDHGEDVEFPLESKSKTSSWITFCAKLHSYEIQSLDYFFCTDKFLLNINKEHLAHDFYTDIITFPYSEQNKPIHAEVFISVDRVKENAESFKTPFQSELHRVIIHGLLHLVGYSDKSEEEKKTMRAAENNMLKSLKL
jgi:probable rRNA maturation factor